MQVALRLMTWIRTILFLHGRKGGIRDDYTLPSHVLVFCTVETRSNHGQGNSISVGGFPRIDIWRRLLIWQVLHTIGGLDSDGAECTLQPRSTWTCRSVGCLD